MRKVIKVITTILAISMGSAFADTYQCEIAISNAEQIVGTIKLEQEGTGMSASNRLYNLAVSKKKNAFGKTVKEVEVVVSGIITSTLNPSEGTFQGDITVVTTTKPNSRRNSRKDSQLITKIDAKNDFSINASGSGYTAIGSCQLVR